MKNLKSFKEKLKEILDMKYRKIITVNECYQTQIKEIDLITTKDDYDKNSHLKQIIDSLSLEKSIEIKKVEEYYDKMIQEFYHSSNIVLIDKDISDNLTENVKRILSLVIEMKR